MRFAMIREQTKTALGAQKLVTPATYTGLKRAK